MFNLTWKSRALQSSVLSLGACYYWSVGDAPTGTVAMATMVVWFQCDCEIKKKHFTYSQHFWIEVIGLQWFWALLSDISASVIQIMGVWCASFFISWRIFKRLPLTSEEVWNKDHCTGCFNHSKCFKGLKQVQNRQFITFSGHGQWCVANWVIGWTSFN